MGFAIDNADGQTVVGHGGGCPGYITSLLMVPKHKLAAVVLTNAADGPADTIGVNLLKTVGGALQKLEQPIDEASVPLDTYAGNYGSRIWGGEIALRPWGARLVGVALPSDDMDNLVKLQHVEGDAFVRVTDDGERREAWVFQRDAKGNVTGVLRHSNVYERL